jgi:membrane-associated protein
VTSFRRVLDSLTDLVEGSPWGYLAVLALVAGDSLLPAVPGEAALFTGGILAQRDLLSAPLVMLAAFVGAWAGDCVAYALGRLVGTRVRDRLVRGRRMAERIAWIERQLEDRGRLIVLTARFIPGGRQATSYSAGALRYPARRFVPIDGLAAALWAVYGTLAGYLGGAAFKDSLWQPLALATLVAVLVGVAGERLRRRSAA